MGGGRPHPGPFRRRLRAGEPRRGGAGAARAVSRRRRSAAGALLRDLPRRAGDAGPGGRCRGEGRRGQDRGRRRPADRRTDARPLQRNLFRARLPGARDGLSAGRGAGPDGARREGLPAHARGPAPGACHPAPRRRHLVRPARAARRFGAGGGRTGGGGACRAGCGRQCAGQRHPRDRCAAGLPAAPGRTPARPEAEDAFGRDLVVRREGGLRLHAEAPAGAGGEAGLPDRGRRSAVLSRPAGGGARRPCRAHCRSPVRIRRAGDGEHLAGAGAGDRGRTGRGPGGAQHRPAGVRRGRPRRFSRDAGRPGAGSARDRHACGVHAARGRQQGCVGAQRPGRSAGAKPAPRGTGADRAARAQPRRARAGEPRGGKLFLARALQRAC